MPRPPGLRAPAAAPSARLARTRAATTWVLVADMARARLFELAADAQALLEIACLDNPDAYLHASARDRLPRTGESANPARHAIEPRTTPLEKSVDRFARDVCDELANGRAKRRYDRLVVVAPPRFRGALHRHLDKSLQSCIDAEISRNLTKWPVERILAHLTK